MITKIIAILVHFFSGEGALIKRMQRYQMRRVAYWQLYNMTEKELKDIGVSRSDINRIAYGPWDGGNTA